ncbi:MAG: 30S ribosomal protein S16 [Candidatus Paceibacterota bacterium]|jgi:small subunit ribosomal protein S16
MLIIRLQRVGRKNDPSFRVLVTESTNSSKSGKFLEILGSYNPRKTAAKTILNAERIQYWLSKGAKLSDTMNNLLVAKKIITADKVNVASKKLGKKITASIEAKKATEKKAEEAKKAEEDAKAKAEEEAKAEAAKPAEEVATEAPATEEVTEAA